MTTERQVAANRQNAQASTGPRTQAGKAASSRNNTRHGLYSSAPVIRGLESETAWDYHRVTIIGGLAPANAVEEALAERVALTLWRLGRIARYEQSVTSQAQDQAPVDLAAEYEDAGTDVARIRTRFADARRWLRAITRFRELPADAPLTGQEANAIVVSVIRQIDGFDLAPFSVPGLISAEDHIPDVPGWTVARVQQFVDAIAEATGRDPDDLIRAATVFVEGWRKRTAYRQLARRLDDLRQERILPQTVRLDNVIRYENHLNRQLHQTLSQLQQLQKHREVSRLRIPYNDYHVDLSASRLPSPYEEERPGEGVTSRDAFSADEIVSEDSNPIPPGQDLHSTSEYTPWQPRYRA